MHNTIQKYNCETSNHIRGRYSRFCRYAGNKASSPAKKLNTTNVNRKGNTATNWKIDLPLNSLFLYIYVHLYTLFANVHLYTLFATA